MSDAVFPRSKPAQPRVQLNIAVPPELKARITLLASRRGCFESSLVRQALEAFLVAAERKAVRP